MTSTTSPALGRVPATPEQILEEKLDAICRMGSLMLSSGTGSFRVKAAMGKVAAALGIERMQAQVGLNEIVATTSSQGIFHTQVVEVPVPVVNTDRISALLRVSLHASEGMTAAELHNQLTQVEQRKPLYSSWMIVFGAAMACAAFAFLNNGEWQECLAAGIASAIGKMTQLLLRHSRFNQLVTVTFASAAASLIYVLVATLSRWTFPSGFTPVHEAALTSALLFLVPGFPLLTAAIDLSRFDFSSGISRVLYATMITLAAGMGAWIVSWSFDLTLVEIPVPDLPWYTLAAFRMIASFAGVLGFAITFNTPHRTAFCAAGIGTIANASRLAGIDHGMNTLICAVAATTLVGLLAFKCSAKLLAPRITLSVPSVLIMIPGARAFRCLVGIINGDTLSSLTNGLVALQLVVALAAGLVIARLITDPTWASTSPTWTKLPMGPVEKNLRNAQAAKEVPCQPDEDE